MKGADSMVYSKAILAGKDGLKSGSTNYICTSGTTCDATSSNYVALAYGHPAANQYYVQIYPIALRDKTNKDKVPDECRIKYTQPANKDSRPIFDLITTGC